MLNTIGSSIASDSRIDDDEVSGGNGAGAESSGSVFKQKVSSNIRNHPEYPEG